MNTNTTSIRGFTLLEIIIAVAIVGILSTIAVPSYLNYVTKAKIASGVPIMSAANTEVRYNITKKGKPPNFIQGAPSNDTSIQIADNNIELIRFDGRGKNKKWFVVRYSRKIFPASYNTSRFKRELHLVIKKNAEGTWVTKCGQWSSGFMDKKYLPKGCDATNIGSWDGLD